MIYVYNRNVEDFSMLENNYYIGRENILSNPYTHLPVKDTKAMFQCKTREEAIESLKGCWYCRYADFHLKEERALEVGICKWPQIVL